MPKLDFSNVKAPEPLEPGDYACTLTNVDFVAKSQTSGNPYIKLTFTVDSSDETGGRKLFRNLSLMPDALWAYKQYMIALGTDADEFDGELDPEEVARENIGHDCVLVVDVKDFEKNGVTTKQNEVKGIRDASFVG